MCIYFFVPEFVNILQASERSMWLTVVAVTTNIESIEFRRRQNAELGYEVHTRAGTTDDVEASFALLHHY